MTSLIIKSKIWNHSNNPIINYKDKKFTKQKMTIEKSGIISLKKDNLIFRQTDNLDNSGNSSQDTNYMNESRNTELISIQKRENDSNFYVNCGDWSKDLMQLIDQSAVYFLYKGLTIENFLKEKQKYYVLNQGDIIKLGKIYLKILHIKLTGSDNDNDEKDKADKATDKHSDNNKKLVSESDSSSDDDDSDSDNDNDSNKGNGNESRIKNDKKEDEERSVIMKRNYSPYDSNNNSKKSEFVFNSYSNKNSNKKNKNMRYNKLSNSFNGNLSDMNLDKKIKENIGIKRSMSFKLKSLKNLSISVDSSGKINNNIIQKRPKKIKSKKSKKKFNNKNKCKPNKTDIDKPQQKKGKICRICLSEEDNPKKNPLICPCTCKGSMKYIHYYCLKNWLNLKIESELGYGNDIETEQPTITYSTKDISCELCKTKLPDYIKHKGQIFNVSFYKPKYSKFIVLESIRDDNRRTKFIHIIPLNKKQIVKIGRLNNCDLSLPDYSISRVHCCMYIETGQLFLENNSKFGTKILVQTPKLLMSPEYPLAIEVQKVYLKISIQKPFSLFGCCNVYTTSVTKMLVYQKQNEKGFDLFCSMVFKEDNDDNAEENIENENENNNEENESNKNDTKNLISNELKGNEDKSNNKEDKNEDKDTKGNNKKNKIVKNYIIKNDEEKQTKISLINIVNKSKEEINKKDNLNNKEINEQQKEEEEKLIDDEYNNNEDIKSIKKEKEDLIDNDDEKSNLNNNKINTKIEKEKEKELIDNNDKSSDDKTSINKLKDNEIELITKDIIKNIMNTENNQTMNTKTENKNNSIIDNKNKVKQNLNDINNIKNEDKKDIKRNINEPKVSKIKEIKSNKEVKKEKETKHKIEFNEKKEIKFNKKEENNKENDNLKNKKKINFINTEEKHKEKKENKEKYKEAKIDYEKDENLKKEKKKEKQKQKQNEYKEIMEKKRDEFKINENYENDNNFKYERKSSTKKKIQKQSIDLNTINDLSYKHGQETSNRNCALENYQSIFGLMPSKKNESDALLAPKFTKNKNLKNFDFNINDEKTNRNYSSTVWNKYTCQYEENKRMKDK